MEAKAAALRSARQITADTVKHNSTTPLDAVIVTNERGQKVITILAKHVLRETLKLEVEPPRRSDEVQSYLGIVRVRHGVPSATVPKTTGIS